MWLSRAVPFLGTWPPRDVASGSDKCAPNLPVSPPGTPGAQLDGTSVALGWLALRDRHGPQSRGNRGSSATEEDAMLKLQLQLMQYLKSLTRREEGQDLLEYALLIDLIAIVCIVAVTAAGAKVSSTFQNIADGI